MALTLSKTGITDGQIITAAQITQSIDALTGVTAYDITISGSLTLTGSVKSLNGFTGSLLGTSSAADLVKITNDATTNQNYRLLFISQSGLPNPNNDGYAQPRFDSGSDGSGLYYNPSTNTLYASKISGSNDGSTPDFIGTASFAATASYAQNVLGNFNYMAIDDVTYTASTSPFPVFTGTRYNTYISQSSGNILGLTFGAGNDGQIINFTPYYLSSNLNLISIEITASADVFGLGGQTIASLSSNTANNLFNPAQNNVKNLTFQYVNTLNPPLFNQPGWYLINNNTQ